MIKKWETNNKRKGLMAFVWFVCVVFLVPMGIQAKGIDNRIETFTTTQGLSNNQITSLYQDSRGYIWIGTSDGLNRYDGYHFKEYRHHPLDSNSITGNFIQSIVETADSNIWVGTRNSGLAVWDKKTGIFKNISREGVGGLKLPENDVYGLEADGPNVWVKTRNFVIRVSVDFTDIEVFGHYSSVFKSEKFNSYPLLVNQDKLWIGSKDGLHLFNVDDQVVKRQVFPEELLNKEITGIVAIKDSNLLLGSSEGVWKYDYRKEFMSQVLSKNKGGQNVDVNCLILENEDKVWVGSNNGLSVSYYPFTSYENFELSEDESMSYQVTAIMVDNSGILWVGTRQDGLIKIDQKPRKFKVIAEDGNVDLPFDTYDFKSIYADDKSLWLGTFEDGVYRVDKRTNKVHHYPILGTEQDGNQPSVLTILYDSDDQLWFGTRNGVYILDRATDQIREFDYANSKEFKSLLKSNEINDILQDCLGDIWFATKFGLYRYNGYEITSYFADEEHETSLCSDEINVLFEDSDGWLWIGTNDGVNVFSAADQMFLKFKNEPGESLAISHNIILSFAQDTEGRIIIGTQSGLSFYDKATRISGFWVDDEALTVGKVYSVEVDGFNRIWVSTGDGISALIPGKSVLHLNKTDGVVDYNFNANASFKYGENQLFFGGGKGLTIIESDSIPLNLIRPEVTVTNLEVRSRGVVTHHFQNDVQSVKFKYTRNSLIQVEFAAMEYTAPSQNSYQVYLEGFDDTWRAVTKENKVSFSNLSPGKYTLKIKGSNSDFVWNNKPTEVQIEIEAPIYMTNYAYVFYLLFGIFVFQVMINYRIRSYRRKFKDLSDKNQDKEKIEAQKEALSKINQSLTDSISYAKRIQEAMIPSEKMVRKVLADSFIYFRPKDIVSGDFYWIYERGDKLFMAAVDCTGHGVPGAFMSIIGYDLLKHLVEIQNLECPSEILNALNKEVVNTFNKNGEFGDASTGLRVNDGMDIALVVIDRSKQIIEFSGAFSPLYIIRDNEIATHKGNRYPIGFRSENEDEELFSKNEISYQKNDIVYIFSDGYADQFGGPDGKKFKYRRFRHLLLNIHKLPMDDQKAILHQKMEEWMGKDYAQIDDILLIGFKL